MAAPSTSRASATDLAGSHVRLTRSRPGGHARSGGVVALGEGREGLSLHEAIIAVTLHHCPSLSITARYSSTLFIPVHRSLSPSRRSARFHSSSAPSASRPRPQPLGPHPRLIPHHPLPFHPPTLIPTISTPEPARLSGRNLVSHPSRRCRSREKRRGGRAGAHEGMRGDCEYVSILHHICRHGCLAHRLVSLFVCGKTSIRVTCHSSASHPPFHLRDVESCTSTVAQSDWRAQLS